MKVFNLRYIILFSIIIFFLGCEDKVISENKKPYEGKTIMVIAPTLNADLIRGPILKNKKEFEEKTGARVRVVTPNWTETIKSIDKSIAPNSNIIYDIYVVIGLWNGTLLSSGKNIAPLPSWVKDKLDWDDVLPIYKNNILTWNNTSYGIPYDGDNISLYYRKDIFEDRANQTKFLKKYGYNLDVPKTWKQYIDIAKFFNGWDWDNDGKVEHGNAGLRIKGDVSLLQFFAFAGAYSKCPKDKSYYFDKDTMKARIANDGFVRSLEEYIELIKYGPKGMKNFAGHDVRDAFIKGEVAMAIDWTDLGITAANSPYSIVANKIGYAQLPGADETFNCKTKTWKKSYNAPSSISGNWTLFVSEKSLNKKLAFEFASFIGSKEKTKGYIVDPSSGINPSRYSHLKDALSWQKAGFSNESAQEYINTIEKSLENKNVIVDIMIPGGAQYYEVLDGLVFDAIEGKYTAKEALELASKEWEKITDSLGRERQKRFYRESLNIK